MRNSYLAHILTWSTVPVHALHRGPDSVTHSFFGDIAELHAFSKIFVQLCVTHTGHAYGNLRLIPWMEARHVTLIAHLRFTLVPSTAGFSYTRACHAISKKLQKDIAVCLLSYKGNQCPEMRVYCAETPFVSSTDTGEFMRI
ncbi:hypothetical protein OPQ81_006640 [Rhizoctonia solani]|nr:hypothetical protein OPQ81_006640 [Rhizoctonia solani]